MRKFLLTNAEAELVEMLRAGNALGLSIVLKEVAGEWVVVTSGRLAVASFLARYGIELRAAFEIVNERDALIDEVVRADKKRPLPRYVITLSLDPELSCGYSAVTGARQNQIRFAEPPLSTLEVDISLIVERALRRARDFDR